MVRSLAGLSLLTAHHIPIGVLQFFAGSSQGENAEFFSVEYAIPVQVDHFEYIRQCLSARQKR